MASSPAQQKTMASSLNGHKIPLLKAEGDDLHNVITEEQWKLVNNSLKLTTQCGYC